MSRKDRKIAQYERALANLERLVVEAVQNRFNELGLPEDRLIAEVRAVFDQGTAPIPPEADHCDTAAADVAAAIAAATAPDNNDHGLARDHAPPLDLPSTQPAVPRLPTVVIGNWDLSLKAHSVEDLQALADCLMLWDVRDRATEEESRGEAQV